MADKKSYTKYNYIDVVQRITPEFYRVLDYNEYGDEEDISYAFLGKILRAALESDAYMDVSGEDTSSLARFFSPLYKTSDISPYSFERSVLFPFGKKLIDFSSDKELIDYFSGTIQPAAALNNPIGFASALSSTVSSIYEDIGLTHRYLMDNLGWFYLLNTSSPFGVSPNTLVASSLIPTIRTGRTAYLSEGVKLLFKYFWVAREESGQFNSLFPPAYTRAADLIPSEASLSGNQMLPLVDLHIDTWLSPANKDPEFVDSSLEIILGGGDFPEKMRDAGPFQRFLKAISLGMADIDNIVDDISQLLDIDTCPEQFLEFLGYYIGWEFITGDFKKWRGQLRDAVLAYKTKGSNQGVDAVLRLIFPTGLFEGSDIRECWEYYVPKMMFYLIYTQSFLAREKINITYLTQDEVFKGGWDPRLTWNVAASASFESGRANHKDNAAFMVDAVLEKMHLTFGNIKVQGVPYTDLEVFRCASGFAYRDRVLAVPPWEKYGFYKETRFGEEVVDHLCTTLSGSRRSFGFEVPVSSVSAMQWAMKESLSLSGADLNESPPYGLNNEFRFFTSSHVLPPNVSGVTDLFVDTDKEYIGLFDYWNTKSSHVFTTLYASSFDWFAQDYDTQKTGPALQAFRKVLGKFIPLHVTPKIIVDLFLEDPYCASALLCMKGDNCGESFNTQTLGSIKYNGYLGASGTGILSGLVVNSDGRVLPAKGGYFWTNWGSIPRSASRRRGYRYSLPCYPITRTGKSMPVALQHFYFGNTSASVSSVSSDDYVNTWEYIVKGFDYQTQMYVDMSSNVWNADRTYRTYDGNCNWDTCTISGINVSSTYPSRAVPETDYLCSSFPVYRDTMGGVIKSMTELEIDRNSTSATFSGNYVDYEWGESYHRAHNIYNDYFNRVFKNTYDAIRPYYGGFSFASYAYGPTLFNNNFHYDGGIRAAVSSIADPNNLSATPYSVGYRPQFSSVVGGSESRGETYVGFDGSSKTLVSPYFDTQLPTPSSTENGTRSFYTTEMLSSVYVEQEGAISKSFIVMNSPWNENGTSRSDSISMFRRDKNPLRVVFPCRSDGADGLQKNFRSNSEFKLNLCMGSSQNTDTVGLNVKIVTGPVSGSDYRWGFNFEKDRWQPYVNSPDFEKELVAERRVVKDLVRTSFHTFEKKTDKCNHPCNSDTPYCDWIVHTDNTDYYVILTASRESEKDGVIIHEISIQDLTLFSLIGEISSKSNLLSVFTFWDSLADGYYSRDMVDSSGTFEASGGSRSEYVDYYGGSNTGTTAAGVTTYNLDG